MPFVLLAAGRHQVLVEININKSNSTWKFIPLYLGIFFSQNEHNIIWILTRQDKTNGIPKAISSTAWSRQKIFSRANVRWDSNNWMWWKLSKYPLNLYFDFCLFKKDHWMCDSVWNTAGLGLKAKCGSALAHWRRRRSIFRSRLALNTNPTSLCLTMDLYIMWKQDSKKCYLPQFSNWIFQLNFKSCIAHLISM